MSYWETLQDFEIGIGVVVPNNKLKKFKHYITKTADSSNLYGGLKVQNNKIVYYAGFGWKKVSPFQNQKK
ncbi:DUF4861 family protein [Flavobacterium sp. PL002]|uniref:DUF4861 family protein n=1 Tax=Flavobacterium sp. PL002 TaxID=1897058 RepID=UPI0019E99FDE|nr:DUF4861 family protein [Flavobacterium sp. PL002]MBE0390203.1 hypothetical protein [Flavobacterium sp. PL002]